MRISAKSRYGLASMIYLAQNTSQSTCINVMTISEELNISKIYLEQVFSLLKKADLVTSTKGASGGYQLSRSADKINAYDILKAIEVTLFESADSSTTDMNSAIHMAIDELLWKPLDSNVKDFFTNITLQVLTDVSSDNQTGGTMYFI